MKVAYGDDDDQKSFQETQGLLQAYPNLKGIISPTTVGISAAARYLSSSSEEGRRQADRPGHAEPDAQVRQGRHRRRVRAVGPQGRRLPGRLRRRRRWPRARSPARRASRSRPAASASARSARTARSSSARRPASTRTTLTSSTSRSSRLVAETRPAPSARVGVFGIGLEAYWPQFDGLRERVEGYQRRVEERVAALWARRWCRPGSSTPPQGAREAGDALRRRPGRPRALPRGDLRDLEPGAARRAGGRGRRSSCSACSRRRRSTTRTPAPASGWPTAPRAACRSWPARSRARGSRTTRSRARSTTTSARGRGSPPGCARPASPATLRRSRIGFLGHTYPGMLDMYSDFTAVHAQVGAHVEVLEIDDLGVRVAAVTDDEVVGQAGRDPRDVRLRRPLRRPDRRADRARAARLVGARRRRGSTGSPPTSTSTR